MKLASCPSLVDVIARAELDAATRRTFYACVNCRNLTWGCDAPLSCRHCNTAIAFVPMTNTLPKPRVLACCE